MKFTKYGTGPHTFYETPVINGIRATIHGTNAIHTFDIKLGARYKITIKNVASNTSELKIYQEMFASDLSKAKALAEHFLLVAGKAA